MKLAVITDSSAFLQAETLRKEDLFVLDIPVNIDGQEYVEGVNLTAQELYQELDFKKVNLLETDPYITSERHLVVPKETPDQKVTKSGGIQP